MTNAAAPALLHIVGYLTGASLYAMLLAMVVRTGGPRDRLTLATALLGVAWNVGELAAHALDEARLVAGRDWVSALSFAALGFLAAVAVHSAGHGPLDDETRKRTGVRMVARASYACAAVAGAMQLVAAGAGWPLPWPPALYLISIGLAGLSLVLLSTARPQPDGRRALWMTALGLFSVSAFHLGQFHGASEGWLTELVGHHASIPLAFAILYQDYRFGFGDLFLKRALTLLALVTIVFVAWSLLAPALVGPSHVTPAIGVLLALWIGTALVFPWLRQQVAVFVDRVVLRRGDYAVLVDTFASTLQACPSEADVIQRTRDALSRMLNAESVTSRVGSPGDVHATHELVVQTTEDPRHILRIGRLVGGRRLLSDDRLMLERVALLTARRIDSLRLRDERYERMLHEREIGALATEAELRALRAQINPHFLFNALTTLGYLIQSAPTRALDTLMRLTTLLRAALRPEGELTTLGHEQELLESYLQIERERFEERLDATVDIPPDLADLSIPSLIVQPLVENAVKHGISGARGGGRIVVTARMDGSPPDLVIAVRNSGAPFRGRAPAPGGGIGLENVERRLRCYYGSAARLTLGRDANGDTLAELRFPSSHLVDEGVHLFVQEAPR